MLAVNLHCSLWSALVAVGVFGVGCSSKQTSIEEDRIGLACDSEIRLCDIHRAACRQDVLDAVACLRGYTRQIAQPEAQFLRLRDLQDSAPDELGSDQRDLRVAYGLFGLVGMRHQEGEEAFRAQIDNIAAFYVSEADVVFIVEDPGGHTPTEAELGMPLAAYQMNVLAHEYVHFLQDREIDLQLVTRRLSKRLDPALAVIAAIEGEASLYELFFNYAAAGKPVSERQIRAHFESYIDYAEREIREADSPVLEARTLFPYTYGAHSNAVVHQREGSKGLPKLRSAESTLEYLQRRWGTVTPALELRFVDAFALQEGFEKLGTEEFGPWLVNAFWSRTTDATSTEALALAQRWSGDKMRVGRHRETREIVANWSIEFDADPTDVARWATTLASQNGRYAEWTVRVTGDRCIEVTSSTKPDSEVLERIGATAIEAPRSADEDAGARDSGNAGAASEVVSDEVVRDEVVSDEVDASTIGSSTRPESSSLGAGWADAGDGLDVAPLKRLDAVAAFAVEEQRLPTASSFVRRARIEQRLRQIVEQHVAPLR